MPNKPTGVTQQSIRSTQQTRSGGRKPAQKTRPSKLRHHYASSGPRNDVKRDIDQKLIRTRAKTIDQTLITTQAVVKDDELERRLDRINDIGKMLRKNGALSTAETKWLRNLHDTDKESYNKIGKLLSVPSFWRLSQHGVSDLEDRNRIRMQTLKAVVHEALRTAKKDDTWQKRKIAVVRAIDKATQVRKVMNARYVGGKKLRIYKIISRETLQNPELFYAENNNIGANLDLARQLRRPRNIHSDIRNQSSVAKAAKALIDNKLLDATAADRLGKMLREKQYGYDVNVLMEINAKDVPHPDDRKKIRSLLLMHLAYYGDDLHTLRVKNYLLQDFHADTTKAGGGQQPYDKNYEELLDLPKSSGPGNSVRRNWFIYMEKYKPRKRVLESASVDHAPASKSPKTERRSNKNIADKTDEEIDDNKIIEEEVEPRKTDNTVPAKGLAAKNTKDMANKKVDENAIIKEDGEASETDNNVPAKNAAAKSTKVQTSEEVASDVLKGIVDNILKEKEEDKTVQKVTHSAHADDMKKDDIDDDGDQTKKTEKIVSFDPPGQGDYNTGDNVFTEQVTRKSTSILDINDPQDDQLVIINFNDFNQENYDYESDNDYYYNPQNAYVDSGRTTPNNAPDEGDSLTAQGTPERSKTFRLMSSDSDDQNDKAPSVLDTDDE